MSRQPPLPSLSPCLAESPLYLSSKSKKHTSNFLDLSRGTNKRGRLDQVISTWICYISFIVLVCAMYSCHSKPDYVSSTEHKRNDFQRYSGCSFVCLSNEQAFRLQKEHKSTILQKSHHMTHLQYSQSYISYDSFVC